MLHFTNGVDDFTISKDLIPNNQVVTEVEKPQPKIFVDIDTPNFRKVLNHYRGSHTPNSGLRHDLALFNKTLENNQNESLQLTVGSTTFYTTAETLKRLPYFQGSYRMTGKLSDTNTNANIDRDPESFKHLLSHLRNPITHPITEEVAQEIVFFGQPISEDATGVAVKPLEHMLLNGENRMNVAAVILYNTPEITFNRCFYRRSTPMHQNTIVIRGVRDKKYDNHTYDIKSNIRDRHDHLLRRMYLTFCTSNPIKNVSDVIDKVSLILNDTILDDWGTYMDNRSDLLMEEKIIQHFSDGVNWVSIPLQFPCCRNLGTSIPMMRLNNILLCLKMSNNKNIVKADDILLTIKVGACDYEVEYQSITNPSCGFEYLYETYHKLASIKVLDDDYHNHVIKFDDCHLVNLKYLMINVIDNTNKRIVCNIEGTFTLSNSSVPSDISVYHINQHTNQMNQYENSMNCIKQAAYTDCGNNGLSINDETRVNQYNPLIWLHSWSLLSIGLHQPSGSFCLQNNEIEFTIRVSQPDTTVEIWATGINALQMHSDKCCLTYQNKEKLTSLDGSQFAHPS